MDGVAGETAAGIVLRSRSAFARRCTVTGVVLVVLGLVGIARLWTVSMGLLLLVLAALVALIGFEEVQHEALEAEHASADSSSGFEASPVPTRAALVARPTARSMPDSSGPTARVSEPPSPAVLAPPAVHPALAAAAPPRPIAASTDPADGPGPVVEAPASPLVWVRFCLPGAVGAGSVTVAGDFNGWSTTATPMRRDGLDFVADVPLVPGRSYRYRFLLDGDRWENDWAAGSYTANEFGSEDSVVEVPDIDHPTAGPGRGDV